METHVQPEKLGIDRSAALEWQDTRLAVEVAGLWATVIGWGPPLLVLHGFTGSWEDWYGRDQLLQPFRAIFVDLPGHGRSAGLTDPERYTMQRTVADLLALLDKLGVERAAVLGYSMGGRVALQLAAAAPERVAALVLVSTTPGIADEAERAARIAADETLAQRIERDGVPAFIDYWEQLPLFAAVGKRGGGNEQRRQRQLQNSAAGLAYSLRGMGTAAQDSLWDRLDKLTMPVLVIAGEHDEKFRTIARRMAGMLPAAKLVVIADAGHRVQQDQPYRFYVALQQFLTPLTRWASKGE